VLGLFVCGWVWVVGGGGRARGAAGPGPPPRARDRAQCEGNERRRWKCFYPGSRLYFFFFSPLPPPHTPSTPCPIRRRFPLPSWRSTARPMMYGGWRAREHAAIGALRKIHRRFFSSSSTFSLHFPFTGLRQADRHRRLELVAHHLLPPGRHGWGAHPGGG